MTEWTSKVLSRRVLATKGGGRQVTALEKKTIIVSWSMLSESLNPNALILVLEPPDLLICKCLQQEPWSYKFLNHQSGWRQQCQALIFPLQVLNSTSFHYFSALVLTSPKFSRGSNGTGRQGIIAERKKQKLPCPSVDLRCDEWDDPMACSLSEIHTTNSNQRFVWGIFKLDGASFHQLFGWNII